MDLAAPVPDMFDLAESEGIFLVRAPSGNANLHAFLAVIKRSGCVCEPDETL